MCHEAPIPPFRTARSTREFTETELVIADAIRRGLAYKQIAALVRLSVPRIKQRVAIMASAINLEIGADGGLAPRQMVLVWAVCQHWEAFEEGLDLGAGAAGEDARAAA